MFDKSFAGCVADRRFTAADAQFRSAWDAGAWWALPAASFIPGISLECFGASGIRSGWDRGAKYELVYARDLTNKTYRNVGI